MKCSVVSSHGARGSESLPEPPFADRQARPPGGLGRAFGVTSADDSVSSGFGTTVAGVLIAAGGIAFSFQLAGAYCVLGTTLALLWWWRHRSTATCATPSL